MGDAVPGLDKNLIEDILAEYTDDEIDEEIMRLLRTKYAEKLSDPDDRAGLSRLLPGGDIPTER